MGGEIARLKGDAQRNATRDEVEGFKRENQWLKEIAGEQVLELHVIAGAKRKDRKRLLKDLGITKSTYYDWISREYAGCFTDPVGHEVRYVWNCISPSEELQVVQYANDHPEQYAREISVGITEKLGLYVSESTVYRILKRHGLLFPRAVDLQPAGKEWRHKTTRPNELWQTDATVIFIVGYGFYKEYSGAGRLFPVRAECGFVSR